MGGSKLYGGLGFQLRVQLGDQACQVVCCANCGGESRRAGSKGFEVGWRRVGVCREVFG